MEQNITRAKSTVSVSFLSILSRASGIFVGEPTEKRRKLEQTYESCETEEFGYNYLITY